MFQVEITKALRANDLRERFTGIADAVIYVASNLEALDGYRIIEYSARPEDPQGSILRPGSVVFVRAFRESSTPEATFATVAAARTALQALSASDGFRAWDLEQPVGSASTVLLVERPPLWTRFYTDTRPYYAGRANQHGREDADRY